MASAAATDVSSELAPLGDVLDALLARLAALEEVAADARSAAKAGPGPSSPTKVPTTPSPRGVADAVDGEPAGAPPASDDAAAPPSSNESSDCASLLAELEALRSENAALKSRLAESDRLRRRAERQLASAGLRIAEDVPYAAAKSKVREIAARMEAIGSAHAVVEDECGAQTPEQKEEERKLREEYFALEREMEKYHAALTASDEHADELRKAEEAWEARVAKENREALRAVRRCVPVDVKNRSEAQLRSEATPSGKVVPEATAKKWKRCNVLELLRTDPESISRTHPASLEALRTAGLTLTERRALHCHLIESKMEGVRGGAGATVVRAWAANKKDAMVARKWEWYRSLRAGLQAALASYESHVERCGPPERHACDLAGNRCPVRADRSSKGAVDYFAEDYGYPEGNVYRAREKAATVSLNATPENLDDPRKLSEDRVKEELRNRRRLARKEWEEAREKEHRAYVEDRAAREVQLEELERQVEECQAEEVERTEEHASLKRELSKLPRGSKDRVPLMKKVNVAHSQCKEARRRGEVASVELERLKVAAKNEKEFVCSVPEPRWDEDGNGSSGSSGSDCSRRDSFDGSSAVSRRSSTSSNGLSENGAMGWNGLKKAERRSQNGVGPGSGSPKGRGGAGRGGLLAAIQGRGRGAGETGRNGSDRGRSAGRGGLLAAIQGRGGAGGRGGGRRSSGGSPRSSTHVDMENGDNFIDGTAEKAPSASLDEDPAVANANGNDAELDAVTERDNVVDRRNGGDEDSRACETKSKTDDWWNPYARKPSKEHELGTPQTYLRKSSGGQGVHKTALVSCPPPSQAETEARSKRMQQEKEALEQKLKEQKEAERSRVEAIEKTRTEAAKRSERLRKEKEARELREARERDEADRKERDARAERMRRDKEALDRKLHAQREEERLRAAAIEKARAEAAERSERLRREKEARQLREARERDEAEEKERERREALALEREEAERNRALAKEAERKRVLDEENRKKEEREREKTNRTSDLERRVRECAKEVERHDEAMKRCKRELKEIPRGPASAKERVAKMKEINVAQQRRGMAKKEAEAVQEELDAHLSSK